jgi:folate-binding protein YgfZ
MDAYEALRKDRLAIDRSGFRFRLEGRDRVRFLHNLCTNDIKGLAVGAGCLATIVDRAAKLESVFKVYAASDHFFLEGVRLPELVQKYAIMDEVKLVPVEGPWRGVFGPKAVAEMKHVPLYHWAGGRWRVPYGYEEPGQADPCDAWEIFRIEQGIPVWGKELDNTVLPVEAGLEEAVSYSKGCYIGQEVLLRLRNFSEPKQRLKGVFLPTTERVTSSCHSRALNRPIGLAILRKGVPGVDLPFVPTDR